MPECIYIGRENELATLRDAWHRAKGGHLQMVVLLDETGLGKTRVVQEIYGWLSETDVEDPQGYWPDTLQIGRSLELNPPAGTTNLKASRFRYGEPLQAHQPARVGRAGEWLIHIPGARS